jgi:hypothetical protein
MIYADADNNLEAAEMNNIAQAASVGSNANLKIVMLIDRSSEYYEGDVVNLSNWHDAKYVEVTGDKQLKDVQTLGPTDMGSATTLVNFLKFAHDNYPSDRYALVINDHGGGYRGAAWDDGSQGDNLSVADLQDAFTLGLPQAGITQLSFLGFDACLMATYEVANAMRRAPIEYMLASEETEPGHGWDYTAFSILAQSGTTSPADLGKAVYDGYWNAGTTAGDSDQMTESFIDLYAYDKVNAALADLTSAMGGASLSQYATPVGQALDSATKYANDPDPAHAYNLVDVNDFAQKLAARAPDLKTKADALQTATSAVVLNNQAGSARTGSNGISVFFPPSSQYYYSAYDNFCGIDDWRNFVKAYYQGGASEPTTSSTIPKFTDMNHQAQEADNIAMWMMNPTNVSPAIQITGNLVMGTGKNVTSARLFAGQSPPGDANDVVLFERETVVADPMTPDVLTGTYDYDGIIAHQGPDGDAGADAGMAPPDDNAFADVTRSDNGDLTIVVPVKYFDPSADAGPNGQDAFIQIVYKANGANFEEVSRVLNVITAGNGGVGAVTPVIAPPGSYVVMQLPVLDTTNGNIQYAMTTNASHFDATRKIDLVLQRLSLTAGQKLFFRLETHDQANQGDVDTATFTQPN